MNLRMALMTIALASSVGAFAPGCSSSSSEPESSSSGVGSAEQSFWTAFHAGDFEASGAVAAKLKANYDANPKDPRNTFLLGAVHFWRSAEAGRDPATAAAVRAESGPLATRYLEEAHDLDPSNTFVTGFLGMNLGGSASDNSAYARAKALVDQAYERDPYFIGFIQMLIAHNLLPSDPALEASVDTAVHSFDLCIGATIDRNHPDLRPYFEKLEASGNPFCWDSPIAPHVLEGVWFHIGDNYLKLGKIDAAKAWYENVRALESFSAWPHKDVLDHRADSDLPALAAAYASGSPAKWPRQGDPPYTCTLCHGNTGR